LSGLAAQTEAVLQRVNGELRQFAGQDANGQLVGSTVVALLLRGERGIVLWAGDSRLYRMRDARLEQLTRDHSLADSLAEFGLLPENGAGGAAHCNVITRAVGAADELGLDRAEFRVLPGDRFLLCSDGIDKELSAEEIGEILSANGDARKAASRLLGLTLEKGARDNATALVVDVPRSEVARDLEEEEAVTVRQKRG
jgi:serine/threonine protein phosphatase PrpC